MERGARFRDELAKSLMILAEHYAAQRDDETRLFRGYFELKGRNSLVVRVVMVVCTAGSGVSSAVH
eukprot:7210427-Prymnesium_polylepis.1